MTELTEGATVKVSITGTVDKIVGDDARVNWGKDRQMWVSLSDPDLTFEDIKPPVEVFDTGDIVRSKLGNLYLLLDNDRYAEFNEGIRGISRERVSPFTSEHYERVQVAVVPF